MSTFNPKLQSEVSIQSPLPPVDNAGLALAEFATNALSAISAQQSAGTTKPRESELKQQALIPFTNRLEELRGSDLSDADFMRRGRELVREFSLSHPEYATAASDIFQTNYGGTSPTIAGPIQDSLNVQIQDWLQNSPNGRNAMLLAHTTLPNGATDQEGTWNNIQKLYFEDQAELAEIEASRRRLQLSEDDEKQFRINMDREVRNWTPVFHKQVTGLRDSILDSVKAGKEQLDTPEEQMMFVNTLIQEETLRLTQKAQEIGLDATAYEPMIEDALKPLTDLQHFAQLNIEQQSKMIDFLKNVQDRDIERKLMDQFGILAGTPEGREALGVWIFEKALPANSQELEDALEFLSTVPNSDGYSWLQTVPSDTQEVIETSSTGIASPSAVEGVLTAEKETPGYIQRNIVTTGKMIASIDTSANPEVVAKEGFAAFSSMYTLAQASSKPLGASILDQIFTEDVARVYRGILSSNSAEAVDFKQVMRSFVANQLRRNSSILNSAVEDMAMVDLENRGGTLVLVPTEPGTVIPEGVGNSGLERAKDAVYNINKLHNFMRHVDGDYREDLQETLNSFVGRPGEYRVAGETGTDRANIGPMLDLIDKTEGGGDYKTLYLHSQRPGGKYAGMDVTQMTLADLIEFGKPGGEYAMWTKQHHGGSSNRATPMGRFQIIGTTMADAAKNLGIPLDALFTEEVQNAMFHFLAKRRLQGKTTMAAKRAALRAEWEGFKHVDDPELDAAIAVFEGSEPPSYEVIKGQTSIRQGTTSTIPARKDTAQTAGSSLDLPNLSTGTAGGTAPPINPTFGGNFSFVPSANSREGTSRDASSFTVEQEQRIVLERLLKESGQEFSDVSAFADETELQQAADEGVVDEGDVVIVNGEPRIVEFQDGE